MTFTRSILSILVPGLVAIAPWVLAIFYLTSSSFDLSKFPALANALVFASAAVIGVMFEGIGSNFEVAWDKKLDSEFAVEENWYAYLSRSFANEPVGYRYLSRLVTTLYFELSMMIAVPAFFLGIAFLAIIRFPGSFVVLSIAALVGMVGSAIYLHKQAKCTHKVICEVRMNINMRVTVAS